MDVRYDLRDFVEKLVELQEAAKNAGLAPVAIQLTGRDDHMTLRRAIDLTAGYIHHPALQPPAGADVLAGTTIYPSHHRRNGAGT